MEIFTKNKLYYLYDSVVEISSFFYYLYDPVVEISTMNVNGYALHGGSESQNH